MGRTFNKPKMVPVTHSNGTEIIVKSSLDPSFEVKFTVVTGNELKQRRNSAYSYLIP